MLGLDWHSGGQLFAACGMDKMVQVFNSRVETKKPLKSIQTIQPVSQVKWIPGEKLKIASCALANDTRFKYNT